MMSNDGAGPARPVAYSVGLVHDVGEGFGFNILNEGSNPLVTFSYSDREDADEALEVVGAVLIKIVSIRPHPTPIGTPQPQ
jgi:hypothetical protein